MNAVELLFEYTHRVSDGRLDDAFDLFADDGAFEFPYFPSVGIGGRVAGIETIRNNIGDFFRNRTVDFKFRDVKIFATDIPERAFGEYSVSTTIQATGRTYNQLYGGRLESASGKIVLLREFCNPVEAAIAIFPNGIADLVARTKA
ncbi:nuclear transport factor 2 family protein [Terriglobus sp. TAA 43]|uniref:nuclear transport factor 2 family protein n=1 Tax=Terriglobus sp. TAA 43 TaxID=278961 RepID=UPI000645E060|nr:nuclear transport factor 2 family protein [Terriglobus sp. TAA 43]